MTSSMHWSIIKPCSFNSADLSLKVKPENFDNFLTNANSACNKMCFVWCEMLVIC